MKFENIKVGDIVYGKERISTGWNIGREFWVPKEVTKVTNKQFYVKGYTNRFKKENGSEVTSSYSQHYISNLGDKRPFGEEVTDQSEEYLAFKNTVKIGRLIKDRLSTFTIMKLNYYNENNTQVLKLLNEAYQLLQKG